MQDAAYAGGETPDVPYLWLDVLVAGLAHRLARIYAPSLEAQRKVDADEAWAVFATTDKEQVPLYFGMGLQSYYG